MIIRHPLRHQEQLQQHQPENDPYLDLETSYVSQLCLTWEALHCQYTQLTTSQSENNSKCYNHSAQQFQQFQVLLQRFIENEPFERGLRPEIYAHTRNTFSKLLQVPNILGQDRKDMTTEEESEMQLVEAPDLIRIIESSILTFQMFVKMDKKKKSNGVRNIFGGQNQMVTPLQQVQSLLDKRKMKLKELWKKRKGGKKNQWPATQEEVELLLALIDVKVISRVLRMVKITKEQLFWSEEKMKKLHVSAATGKLQRDPSPILFPCLKYAIQDYLVDMDSPYDVEQVGQWGLYLMHSELDNNVLDSEMGQNYGTFSLGIGTEIWDFSR
ncbi:putative ribosomal protein L34Ae [Tanacetum coccineum]